MDKLKKPQLSFWQIWNMNVGFLGIQFSFGLQQLPVNSVFVFLGAEEHSLPILNIAGPITGLVIQPIIGAISDKTWSPKWGRRKPFFLIGAILGSLCLFLFPFSPALWVAVTLLWILDIGNNTAMEPYRAFVGDKLPDNQLNFGYQMQSLFVGAGILLAMGSIKLFQHLLAEEEVTGTIPQWVYIAFFFGSFLSLTTVLWTIFKTPEIPPSKEEQEEIEAFNSGKPSPLIQIISVIVVLFSVPISLGLITAYFLPYLWTDINILVVVVLVFAAVWIFYLFRLIKNNKSNAGVKKLGDTLAPFVEVAEAFGEMPKFMWKLSIVYFFQWYALFVYWQFIMPLFKTTMSMSTSEATAQAATMSLTYNAVTMLVALVLVPVAAKFGGKKLYILSLFGTALAVLLIPFITNPYLVLIPMVLFGIGWATMMGIPYSMVSKIVPQERRGVYMGILNMMIVIPMFIETISFGPIYKYLLGNNAVNAMIFAGVFFALAAVFAFRLNVTKEKTA
ncbi:MFS transporter [Croceivirga lutea]|uniref:MFS transporter n=1 Tax=Croceivirga lutea TaxID=1775167 RepID=UPI001E5D7730|nr:MFS transporter [Croceivirga lutea]